ncbi:chemotaxis protein CheA [Stakelama sediminis]|uniref:Chemotaxis protein CheA n=1 Tax=Stakelama sediminis TaxID=463200 RepID=A0A840YU73_9SPHN|nr:chemotaxis protein CheA [Stakelama sediminis]MBB5717104.1 two-component system chemotaxis sensor kinase CheA [Stakelama sediminis]
MNAEEIQGIFFIECEEALAAAEAGLEACSAGTQDNETVNAIFRAVHSIKGGAGAFGFTALQAFTHGFETLLSDVRDGTVMVSEPLVSLMLRALDTLSDHVEAARSGSDAPADEALLAELAAAQADGAGGSDAETQPAAEASVVEQDAAPVDGLDFDLDAMLSDIEHDAEPEGTPWRVRVRPHAGAMANGSEPLLLLRELDRLGGSCIACDVAAVPVLERLEAGQAYLSWLFELPASVSEDAVQEIFDFIGDDCEVVFNPAPEEEGAHDAEETPTVEKTAQAPANDTDTPEPKEVDTAAKAGPEKAAPAARAGQSIRIDLGKLDRLIDTVGELVIAQAMMAQRFAGQDLAAVEELSMLDGLTRELQESAMSIRAQPIGSVFSRVPRILRELESSTGKAVNLEVSGEATELDKTVIERLSEPLTHLIRNAVDHGIEGAEARIAAGKPAKGTLCVSAEHRSGRIVIKIADDGAGINRERVFGKAVENGLIAADAQLSNEEIDNLIFAPGFSTAQTVSNVSGRGVGMDVVRQNVKELGGRITIDSTPGEGTVFTLALPLTLAISDGMIVTVGDQTLVVPLAHVVESLRPDAKDVQGLGTARQMLNVRGNFLPVLSLEESVGARNAVASPTEGVLIVVDTESAGQAALLVDGITDQRQFVIKSLDTHYRSVDGVAGATILGDGRVALILDIDGLVTNAVHVRRKEAA